MNKVSDKDSARNNLLYSYVVYFVGFPLSNTHYGGSAATSPSISHLTEFLELHLTELDQPVGYKQSQWPGEVTVHSRVFIGLCGYARTPREINSCFKFYV